MRRTKLPGFFSQIIKDLILNKDQAPDYIHSEGRTKEGNKDEENKNSIFLYLKIIKDLILNKDQAPDYIHSEGRIKEGNKDEEDKTSSTFSFLSSL